MSLLKFLNQCDICYSVVAVDSFMYTDWFVMVHRKDARLMSRKSSGVSYYDLKPDLTFIDEIFHYDLDREEVVEFFDLIRNGMFKEILSNEHGIIYEQPHNSFMTYCSRIPKKRVRRKLNHNKAHGAL